MRYHVFSCKDAGSDTGEAIIIIASRKQDLAPVGDLLREKLMELGRSDLMHSLKATTSRVFILDDDPHVVFTNIQEEHVTHGPVS